jgi:2-dehydropantoate 2-reductase
VRKYAGPNFRIAIVGSGAVGSYYGAKLAYFGRDVHFLVRSGLKEIRRFGIQVRAKKEGFRLAKAHAYATPEEIGPSDLVLVALKATSNEDLCVLVPPLLHEKTIILTLQNGLGNEEFLARNFGAERVIGSGCHRGAFARRYCSPGARHPPQLSQR